MGPVWIDVWISLMVNFPDQPATELVVVDSDNNTVVAIGPGPEIDIIDPTSGITLQLATQVAPPSGGPSLPGIRWEMAGATTDPEIIAADGGDGTGVLLYFSGAYTNPASITAFARTSQGKGLWSGGIVRLDGERVGGCFDAFDAVARISVSDETTATQLNSIDVGQTQTVATQPIIKDLVWNSPTFSNGWSGSAQYRKNADGTVSLQGLITPGTRTGGTTIFNLPSGYRPTVTMEFVCSWTGGGFWNKVRVGTNGNVDYFDGTGSGTSGYVGQVRFSTV